MGLPGLAPDLIKRIGEGLPNDALAALAQAGRGVHGALQAQLELRKISQIRAAASVDPVKASASLEIIGGKFVGLPKGSSQWPRQP